MEEACTSGCTQTWTLDGMYDSGMTRLITVHTILIIVLFIDEYTVEKRSDREERTTQITNTKHTGWPNKLPSA